MSISTLASKDIFTSDLDQLDQSFMYSQLIKEIVLELDYDAKAKADLGNYCRRRQTSDGGGTVSSLIDKFEQDYECHSPIWWYTCGSFLFGMLNQALRTQDTEALVKMGFVIRDIHRKIKELHNNATPRQLTVYRGQSMSADEFTKIRNNKDGLISFNNFLSTSIDRDVAYMFAESTLQNPQMMLLLFQIEIEPMVSRIPFAELKGDDCVFGSENEVLFSMHTIFRIREVTQIKEGFWNVELKLTSDNDRDLAHLTEQLRKEIKGGMASYRLGHLLIKMGKFKQTEEVLLKLINSVPNRGRTYISSTTHQLGAINRENGNFQAALMFYYIALTTGLNSIPIDFRSIAITCNDIGLIHRELGNYLRALAYYQKALEYLEDPAINSDRLELATAYNNVGQVFQSMGAHSTALGFFRRTLAIEKEILPPNHPAFATVHNNIGTVHSLMGNHSLALQSYRETCRIEGRSLPTDHGTLVVTYNNLGEAHRSNGDYEVALQYYQKAIDIGERSLPENHPSIAAAYCNKAIVYFMKQDHWTAKKFFEKAREILEQTVPPDSPDLAIVYVHIGQVHVVNTDYFAALQFFRKALRIQKSCLLPNDLNLARTYACMAEAFYLLGNHLSAVKYIRLAIDIARQENTPAAKQLLEQSLEQSTSLFFVLICNSGTQ
ncbi:unnamed protein product [Didymodactylos carnosus]|uniref:Uncharacterized protein n=1 Tax=Didymodactylos carnosus TaxID=1234261 RepID=A0A8S2EJD4_9BILA|nr:unnamed protein product [Didymodactylos carnosus]CAF3975201.1 unnamed protein product [Didymodactylos carnosus]